MKKVYIIATPSGRSIISIRDDPRKALFKTKKRAIKVLKSENPQRYYKVKLRIKSLMISNKTFGQHW